MDFSKSIDDREKTWLDALHMMNRHLAIVKGRLEIVLAAGIPEYVKSDLVTVYQAEREISQIVRGLIVGIMQGANQLQEGNSI